MLFRKSPEKFWNLFATKYAATQISDRLAYETKIKKIKSYLSPEHVVLDIGCGTGTQCGDLASHARQVTGIDISDKLLEIAEQRTADRKLTNVNFLKSSIFDKRFQPGRYDVVMAFFVLHFFEDLEEVLQRVHELLRPGGLFISETACLGEKSKIAGQLIRLVGQLGFIPRINILTTQQLEQALEQAGFRIVDKNRFSDSADAEYTLFAKKD